MRKLFKGTAEPLALKDCKSILGASFGKTDVTQFVKYILAHKEEMKSGPKNSYFCDDLHTYKRAFVVVVEDKKDALWYDILTEDITISVDQKINKKVHIQSCNNHGIQIVLAVYGMQECSKQVSEIFDRQTGNELSVHASNTVFGDPWPNVFKSFTLVYRIKLNNGDWSECRMKVCEEHALLTINLFEELISLPQNNNSLSLSPMIRQQRYNAFNNQVCKYISQEGINILAATYGPEDVTEKIKKQFLNEERTYLRVDATNEVFGDTWGGVIKYLIVFYRIDKDDDIYVASKVEGQTLILSKHNHDHILTAPFNGSTTNQDMIKIHGAMLGNTNKTLHMREYFENNEGAEKAITINEGQHEHSKCLIMLYTFGDSSFKLFMVKNGERKSLFNTQSKYPLLYIENNRRNIVRIPQSYASEVKELYINFVYNELLIKTRDEKVFVQNWKSGDSLLKNHKNSKQSSPVSLVRHLMENRSKLRGPLITFESDTEKFIIPLFEVTSADMRRKHLPQIIRNNLVNFLDGTIPDQPGITKFSSPSLFSLSDLTIHFQ